MKPTALMTAIYPAPDLAAAKAWYAKVFGVEPYFDQPFYVGFDIGGWELGLVPSEPGKHDPGRAGVTAYWGVDDAHAAHARLVELGATSIEDPHDVGGDIVAATVLDPFGNALGILRNPHFKHRPT